MPNTRKGPKGFWHVRKIKISFKEWMDGVVNHTMDEGHRTCPVCRSESTCRCIKGNQDLLSSLWKCENGHQFIESANGEWFEDLYNKKQPVRFEIDEYHNKQPLRHL